MKQYKITSASLPQSSPDDAYLSPDDPVHEIKLLGELGGLGSNARLHEYRAQKSSDTFASHTGLDKSKIMREQNIKPGDLEWFKLWFGQPQLIKKDSNEGK